MRTRFKSLYAVLALFLIVWAFVRPAVLPLVLLVGLAVVAGVHALAGLDARRGPGGRAINQHIDVVRSRYPDGSA